MSNSEENKTNEPNEVEGATASEATNDSSKKSSKSNFDEELLKAQLEAENAVAEAIKGVNKTINP